MACGLRTRWPTGSMMSLAIGESQSKFKLRQ
jgi:hypothetical protein